ncbi:3189078f-11c6-4b2d-b040-843fb01c3d55 [Thermothielavioides terrestris]|uniref:3189078f-11c6-4b2d-b040-843fb01c3d55 n=1 Tax=Thermothielavioides terrestris TaxID=2587410 RepID=A0A446B666_9PEZI|nr:3189078f-11c6-4b2d-b040-843fb01c3d55 [Thermothielavioides terrestris]
MDAHSPPKRMTRARAAAATSESAAKSTRAVTTTAKARTTRSSSTNDVARTAIKRKSPADEDEEDRELAPAKKMPTGDAKPTRGRGRPKKVAFEQAPAEPAPEPAPATTVRTRGRPKKTVDPVADEPVSSKRTTRNKKSERAAGEEMGPAAEPIKNSTRGRPAISTSATKTETQSLSKPAIKKTVKFEEPEKENMVPATKTAPTTGTAAGLRGKPVRKAASATAARSSRSTRAAASTAEPTEKEEKPAPLSPKKVNQLVLNLRVESDDELGMDEKVPVKRLKKLPIKPALGATKPPSRAKTAAPCVENDENAASVARPETEAGNMLASPAKRLPPSPWKGSIKKSPARRVEGLLTTTALQLDSQDTGAPTKTGLLLSPAKRQPLNLNPPGADGINGTGASPVKLSLLSSPAKRPISPAKPLSKTIGEKERMNQSPAAEPTLLATPLAPGVSGIFEERRSEENALDRQPIGDIVPESPKGLGFPGRLSAVLPRHADPTLTPPMLALPEEAAQHEVQDGAVEQVAEQSANVMSSGEPMALDREQTEGPAAQSASTTPPSSPPKAPNPMFELREQVLNPYDNGLDLESDDESPAGQNRFTSAFTALPTTPCAAHTISPNDVTRSAGGSAAIRFQSDSKFGFTPLAQQLSRWTAAPSPIKAEIPSAPVSGRETEASSTLMEPAQSTFFEDEMHARPEATELDEEASTDLEDDGEPILEDVSFTEEDAALAAEANDMSLLEREQNNGDALDPDDSRSHTSEQYGDENEFPVEPPVSVSNVANALSVPPVTPQRIVHREFYTVTKVPLKAADNSTPQPQVEKRSYSASRLPPVRPTERLTRDAAIIACSPSKRGDGNPFEEPSKQEAESLLPVTPEKSDVWSTIGTPARTPRRDVNPALLRGAVVFVDVHTSEGADASGLFVELLTQMGARCVKSWSWNPNNSSEQGGDPRVGITHVVYKDGGKRTLEKVRASRGCERENEWLDEGPYSVDTTVMPRGGARRRKSMEPRAIANLDGILVPSSAGNSSRGSRTAPSTPANNRRASALWIRSPEVCLDDNENNDIAEDNDEHGGAKWAAPLTPVPKTPAPETIARIAANLSPGSTSPSSVGSVDSEDPLARNDDSRRHQEMLTRTCPPKRTAFVELGEGILSREKDERVLMRLMAARRKSLQFAPKVGSPLAKSWKASN